MTNTVSFRVKKEIKQQIERATEELGVSRSKFASDALILVLNNEAPKYMMRWVEENKLKNKNE